MKFCKDCKHYDASDCYTIATATHKCRRLPIVEREYVCCITGEIRKHKDELYCSIERDPSSDSSVYCGKQAIFFIPK